MAREPNPMYSTGKDTKLRFCILPHRCAISRKTLWLQTAYRIKEEYYAPGMNGRREHQITYTWWVDKHEYIMEKLKA